MSEGPGGNGTDASGDDEARSSGGDAPGALEGNDTDSPVDRPADPPADYEEDSLGEDGTEASVDHPPDAGVSGGMSRITNAVGHLRAVLPRGCVSTTL